GVLLGTGSLCGLLPQRRYPFSCGLLVSGSRFPLGGDSIELAAQRFNQALGVVEVALTGGAARLGGLREGVDRFSEPLVLPAQLPDALGGRIRSLLSRFDLLIEDLVVGGGTGSRLLGSRLRLGCSLAELCSFVSGLGGALLVAGR